MVRKAQACNAPAGSQRSQLLQAALAMIVEREKRSNARQMSCGRVAKA